MIQWGCGAPCMRMSMVDARTGELYYPPISFNGVGARSFDLPLLTVGKSVPQNPRGPVSTGQRTDDRQGYTETVGEPPFLHVLFSLATEPGGHFCEKCLWSSRKDKSRLGRFQAPRPHLAGMGSELAIASAAVPGEPSSTARSWTPSGGHHAGDLLGELLPGGINESCRPVTDSGRHSADHGSVRYCGLAHFER